MALGATLTIVQAGATMTVPIEQVYAAATVNKPTTIIVNMTIPNLQGATAKTPGTIPRSCGYFLCVFLGLVDAYFQAV